MKYFLISILLLGSLLSSDEGKKRIEIVSYSVNLPIDLENQDRYGSIREKYDIHFTHRAEKFLPHFKGDDANLHKLVFFEPSLDPKMATLPKEKSICFRWEPFRNDLLRLMHFSRIYTFNDDLVDNKRFFKFYYPVLKPMISDIPSFGEKQFCIMIARRWNPERVKMLDFFAKKPKDSLHVYGTLRPTGPTTKYWNHPMFKGPLDGIPSGEAKIQMLRKYRFCICFENVHKIPGYITEKIFDVFAAGCVPVYYGPDNIEKYIPSGCFIDFRKFKNSEEMYQFLTAMTEEEYEVYLQNIRAFLASDQAQLFSKENFEKIFCDAVLN